MQLGPGSQMLFFGGREATTGNASAVRRLKCCCCKMHRPTYVKESGFLPSWFLPVESKILLYIFLVESRIPLTIGIQKTASTNKKHVQYMESGIQGVEFRIQQCLGFLYMGWKHRTSPQTKTKKFVKRKSKKKSKLIWETVHLMHNGS